MSGCLFDAYPLNGKMVFWIKQEKDSATTVRLEDDNWTHSVYAASDDKTILNSILSMKDKRISDLIKYCEFKSHYERITDTVRSDVLKLTLGDSNKAVTLARTIEAVYGQNGFCKIRLYNVDLLPAQSYFYEHDIFPLADCKVVDSNGSSLKWHINDSVLSTYYNVPHFKTIHLKINTKKEGKRGIPKYTDEISSIVITIPSDDSTIEIQNKSEVDMIAELTKEVRKVDPDFVFTDNGDSFDFPYLIHRAEENNVEDNLILGRESSIPLKKPAKEGTSYFSYGRTYFKPAAVKLLGRIHIDINNSFIYNDAGLEGLYEIARICRMPLHIAARASIGKCLSSLQFYYATKKEILIPWKPTLAEHFKTYDELLIADRGGLIFEPEIGVHENVAEFDFASLYPNIMLKKNLSAETIRCYCCPDSVLRVPELDYNICEKRTGIIPTSLKIVLEKRAKYKKLKNNNTTASSNSELKAIYEARQSSLKWILVTSFGYLGFNNAKFGRIDAHIAVCAFDRQILLRTAGIAEKHGFKVLHGIVDSIWVKKKERDDENNNTISTKRREQQNYRYDDYLELKESVQRETGFDISFEGIYKWIAFVNSKIKNNPNHHHLPVPNRYFGVFEDGTLKVRGIEERRHDTPLLLSKCQREILELMATGNSINEVKALIMLKVNDIIHKYVQLLKENKVSLEELVFTKRLSKNSNNYQNRNTIENNALMKLNNEGKSLRAGEVLQYIITDYYQTRSKKNRAIPIELINHKRTFYDVRKYTELLIQTCNSVIEPFGIKLNLGPSSNNDWFNSARICLALAK
ncbi:MAG: DNA polymerase domain-containing protein [Candidatus Nitrosopolaris sp.]